MILSVLFQDTETATDRETNAGKAETIPPAHEVIPVPVRPIRSPRAAKRHAEYCSA